MSLSRAACDRLFLEQAEPTRCLLMSNGFIHDSLNNANLENQIPDRFHLLQLDQAATTFENPKELFIRQNNRNHVFRYP